VGAAVAGGGGAGGCGGGGILTLAADGAAGEGAGADPGADPGAGEQAVKISETLSTKNIVIIKDFMMDLLYFHSFLIRRKKKRKVSL